MASYRFAPLKSFSGSIAMVGSAAERSAPLSLAAVRSAFQSLAVVRFALLRWAKVRSAKPRSALRRLASWRSASTTVAPSRLTSWRSAEASSAPPRFVPLRLAPRRLAPARLASRRSGCTSGFFFLHSFHGRAPCLSMLSCCRFAILFPQKCSFGQYSTRIVLPLQGVVTRLALLQRGNEAIDGDSRQGLKVRRPSHPQLHRNPCHGLHVGSLQHSDEVVCPE